MHLVDVEPDDPRLAAEVLPVLAELRPHLTPEALATLYAEGHPQGLRFLAAYDDAGRCVGVAGYRIHALALCGRKLYVDDLVTTEHVRSTGVGRALLTALEERARAAGCGLLDLDSAVHRHHAHRFYLRERMDIVGHHFAKVL